RRADAPGELREARAAHLRLQGRGDGVPHLPVRLSGEGHPAGRPVVPLPPKGRPPAGTDRGLVVSEQVSAHLGGRILNIPVPQTGHTPFRAGRPLAIFTCCAFEIVRFALHFTQYPSSAAIGALPAFAMSLLHSGAGARGRTVTTYYGLLKAWE